ncbi:glycosyltransferase family 2 protein [Geodermatophilus ruber]|uniref:glycosyltransferase family 2 protein n=1 Tax=Geodermatophilus ruber TaxID=504800 RepID=UPI0015A703E8|nr:glycosyltransferase family 2 protein [Geodermatophilus ruber]
MTSAGNGNPGEEIEGNLVTVVIPARNEERAIRDCVASIQAQTYRELQIIVVDGDSDDDTAEIVKDIANSDPRVELIINPQRVIPVSLNMAVAAARGRWLVRVDAHATVPPDYVARAVEHLATGRWGGVGGRKDGVGRTPAGRAIAVAMASRFGVGGSTYHHGTTVRTVDHVPFGAYPLSVIRELGGWDERLRVNQDFEFDRRVREAGYELLFDPALRIDWECRQSVPDLFRQYQRYGRGKVRVARLHPRSLRIRHLTAPALVAGMAGAGVVALRRPRRGLALVAPYLGGIAVASAITARPLDREARPWVAPAFAAMHVSWGIGFWKGVGEMLAAVVRGRDDLR